MAVVVNMDDLKNPTKWGGGECLFESLIYVNGSKTPKMHTVDVWTPSTSSQSPKQFWVILAQSPSQPTSLHPHITKLLNSASLPSIAGFASINYRLSPHPTHPTHLSSPDDPNRNAKHPDHLNDILSALIFLSQKYTIGRNYLLLGHSCGATLSFQVDCKKWHTLGDKVHSFHALLGILGVSGIYDLNAMVAYHSDQKELYESFTQKAFGMNEEEWKLASPTDLRGMSAWMAAKVVGIAHSPDDGLVEMEQLQLMQRAMEKVKRGRLRGPGAERERKGFYIEMQGGHESIWQKGVMSEAIEMALELLVKD